MIDGTIGADSMRIGTSNTISDVFAIAGPDLLKIVTKDALQTVTTPHHEALHTPDAIVKDRDGAVLVRTGAT